MIIDFHTHIFPDSIAEKTIGKLGALINQEPYTNATLQGIKESMKTSNIDLAVLLPVVTRPAQFQSVNAFAKAVTGQDGLISFGGIHPKTENYQQEIDEIVQLGLKGIKLHPDFQDTFIDEPCYINLIGYALEKDLIVSVHGGVDAGLPDPVHCPPEKTLKMIREVQKRTSTDKLVIAHTGGHLMWDDVEQYLVGEKIYMDISYSRKEIPREQMIRIIRNHGVDKMLFGSDSPWDGQGETIGYVRKLPFSEEEKAKILGGNAEKLLDL